MFKVNKVLASVVMMCALTVCTTRSAAPVPAAPPCPVYQRCLPWVAATGVGASLAAYCYVNGQQVGDNLAKGVTLTGFIAEHPGILTVSALIGGMALGISMSYLYARYSRYSRNRIIERHEHKKNIIREEIYRDLHQLRGLINNAPAPAPVHR